MFDEARFRALLTDVVRQVLREELKPADYLTVREAAAHAKVAPETIRDWIAAGRLTRHRAGRQWRVSRAELEAAMTARGPRKAASPEAEAAKFLERHTTRKAG